MTEINIQIQPGDFILAVMKCCQVFAQISYDMVKGKNITC